MFVTYRPAGEPEQHFEFTRKRLRSLDGIAIEKVYGGKIADFFKEAQQGGMTARRVLLWHLMRKTHPQLKYVDTPDFCDEELVVEHSVEELGELVDSVRKSRSVDEETREQILAELGREIEEAQEREGIEEPGKANSPTSSDCIGQP